MHIGPIYMYVTRPSLRIFPVICTEWASQGVTPMNGEVILGARLAGYQKGACSS